MPHFIFIMVAHINDDSILIVNHCIVFSRIDIFTFFTKIKYLIIQAIGYNLFSDLYFKDKETLAIIIDGHIEAQMFKTLQ